MTRAPDVFGVVHEQAVKDVESHVREARLRMAFMMSSRSSTENRGAFCGLVRIATMTSSKQACASLDDVEVSVGERIKRTGIDSSSH